MKVEVRELRWGRTPDTTHTVWLVEGCQSFEMRYDGSKAECTWYAKMVRKALKKSAQNK